MYIYIIIFSRCKKRSILKKKLSSSSERELHSPPSHLSINFAQVSEMISYDVDGGGNAKKELYPSEYYPITLSLSNASTIDDESSLSPPPPPPVNHYDVDTPTIPETDLDTGSRRTLRLVRETDLDRAVSMLSLHPNANDVHLDTRRSFSALPLTEIREPERAVMQPAISANELQFITARERLRPATWWTQRDSAQPTGVRMKHVERLSKSQLSLCQNGSALTASSSPNVSMLVYSPLIPRSRERTASVTPQHAPRMHLRNLSDTAPVNFELPSEKLA